MGRMIQVFVGLLIGMSFGASVVQAQPAPPARLVQRSGDRTVNLHWDAGPEATIKGYRIFKSTDSTEVFDNPLPGVFRASHYVDFNVDNGQPYFYGVRAVDTDDQDSGDSGILRADPGELDDEAFLNLVQQTAFDFFWYEANPANGLIRDRNTTGSSSSIASVGFGLSAIAVGVDRGWITRDEGVQRVLTTLRFFWESEQSTAVDATGYRGFYYHFLDMETGTRSGTTELSTVDTALLLAGVIHAGAYFDAEEPAEAEIRALADSINSRVEWTWARIRPPLISHGWRPEGGFLAFDWGGYNEAMIVYLIALGSPTYPVSTSAWPAWTSSYTWGTHYGYSFVVFPPLFGHQYTHAWFDFRGIQDAYMRGRGIDYFENSRRATLANRAYSIANPLGRVGYGENVWGLTASDVPGGYSARGAPPAQNDDGTLAPTAPGGSIPFAPDETIAALRHLYATYRTQIWFHYGFRDAFNLGQNWFATSHIGIDQGPLVLMIENYRTGRVWDVFMRSDVARQGLERAGFVPTGTAVEPDVAVAEIELSTYPLPARDHATVQFELTAAEPVRIVLYDLLGRVIRQDVAGWLPPGIHTKRIERGDLAAGVYVVLLERAGAAPVRATVVFR